MVVRLCKCTWRRHSTGASRGPVNGEYARDELECAVRRQRSGLSTSGGQSVGDPAPDEVIELCLDTRGLTAVRRQSDRLCADIVAQARLDRIGGIELEHRLHLVNREAVKIRYSGTGQVSDGFNEHFARDAFVD